MHDNNYALQAENDVWELLAERDRDFAPLATEADAHLEWHRNAGVPVGTPGCPQDACHGDDRYIADNGCDRCRVEAELYHDETSGLALCDPCTTALDREREGRGNEPAFVIPAAAIIAAAEPELELAPVTWTRLKSGAWGLRGPASVLLEGSDVTVTRRNGETKAARVGRVLWTDGSTAITKVAR